MSERPTTLTIQVHVAVDSRGQWFAWGSGRKSDCDFRDESLALFNATAGWLNHADAIGCDEADVERFTIMAEIPIPDHVVFAQSVKREQRTLFPVVD